MVYLYVIVLSPAENRPLLFPRFSGLALYEQLGLGTVQWTKDLLSSLGNRLASTVLGHPQTKQRGRSNCTTCSNFFNLLRKVFIEMEI